MYRTEFLEPRIYGYGRGLRQIRGTFFRTGTQSRCDRHVRKRARRTGRNRLSEAVKICRDAGKKVILDTSGKLLEMGIEAKPTMIKPNLDEIRMLTGKQCDHMEDMIEAAKVVHEKGVEIVAVSLGGGRILCCMQRRIFRARVPKIDAVNTVDAAIP